LFRAADALQAYANHTGEERYFAQALRTVDAGFGRLDQTGRQEPLTSILAGAYATKSLCLGRLGHASESLRVLDEAVHRFPENMTLLTARGLRKQELGLADAVDDFRQAVARGTSVAWAYVELARDSLRNGRNPDAVDLCRRGIALAQGGRVTAILFEMLAIGLLRLNDSAEAVRATFQTAGEIDPLSEEIRFNREQFEDLAANGQTQ
jgi:tetratricopeptide (TPR) repeat protein